MSNMAELPQDRGRSTRRTEGDCPDFCVSKNGTAPFASTTEEVVGEQPLTMPRTLLDNLPRPPCLAYGMASGAE